MTEDDLSYKTLKHVDHDDYQINLPKIIFSEFKPFNKKRFREIFLAQDKDMPQSFHLSELFDYYIEKSEDLMPKTKDSLRYTKAGKTRIASNATKAQSLLKGHQGFSFFPV